MRDATRPYKLELDSVHRLLSDSSTHGILVLTVCLYQYPDDYFDVDPLEIYARLNEDFGVELNQGLESKLQAITVAMTSNLFEEDPSVYDSVIKSLADGDPDLQEANLDVEVDEMLWAEYEVRLAKGEDAFDFSPAVAAYKEMVENGVQDAELEDIADSLEDQRIKLLIDLQSIGFEIDILPDI